MNKSTLKPLALAAMVAISILPATAAVSVIGVSDLTTDIGFSADASATDLINAGSSSLASGPTYSAPAFFGPNANNDGTVGASGATGDITFWLGAPAGEQYTITYALDISTNSRGYDIDSIQTIHGWISNSGNQKNQNYVVETSAVGSAAFSPLATVAYLPFTSANTGQVSTKVNITESTGNPLASGVDAIRFTYTVPSPTGTQGSPTIREIDVFGAATIPEPSSSILCGLSLTGLLLRRRR